MNKDEYIKKLEEQNEELQEVIAKLEGENASVITGMKKMIEEICHTTYYDKMSFRQNSLGVTTFRVPERQKIQEALLDALDHFEETFEFHSSVKKIIGLQKEALKYKKLYNKTKRELNKLQKKSNRKFDKFMR